MGLFDTVWVECPKCGEENGFQSKSGDCILANYNLKNCPDDVMENVNRHSPYVCECGSVLYVDIPAREAMIIKDP